MGTRYADRTMKSRLADLDLQWAQTLDFYFLYRSSLHIKMITTGMSKITFKYSLRYET